MPYLNQNNNKKKGIQSFHLKKKQFYQFCFQPLIFLNKELKSENSYLYQSLQRRHLHHSAIHYPTVVTQGFPCKAPSLVQRTSTTADIHLSFSTTIKTNTFKSSQTPPDGGSEQQKLNLCGNSSYLRKAPMWTRAADWTGGNPGCHNPSLEEITHCSGDGWWQRSIRHVRVVIHIWHHDIPRITRVWWSLAV